MVIQRHLEFGSNTGEINRKSSNEQSFLKDKKEQSFFKQSVCRSCQVSTRCIGETKDLTIYMGSKQGGLLLLIQVSAMPTERGAEILTLIKSLINKDFNK